MKRRKRKSFSHISVVNHSTAFPQDQMQDLVDALQVQLNHDFAPAWGIDAHLELVTAPSAGTWVLALFDNSDQAGALGYHDLTPDGFPLGKVFAQSTIDDGGQVSVTASHELLEMLGDPDVNLSAEVDDAAGNPSRIYAYEVCDAVEADDLGYPVTVPSGNAVQVSDFVFPAWFESFRAAGSTQFDFRQHVTAPLTLTPGGYIGFLDLSNVAAGWQQLTNGQDVSSVFPAGTRRSRRALHSRVRSTYALS